MLGHPNLENLRLVLPTHVDLLGDGPQTEPCAVDELVFFVLVEGQKKEILIVYHRRGKAPCHVLVVTHEHSRRARHRGAHLDRMPDLGDPTTRRRGGLLSREVRLWEFARVECRA